MKKLLHYHKIANGNSKWMASCVGLISLKKLNLPGEANYFKLHAGTNVIRSLVFVRFAEKLLLRIYLFLNNRRSIKDLASVVL